MSILRVPQKLEQGYMEESSVVIKLLLFSTRRRNSTKETMRISGVSCAFSLPDVIRLISGYLVKIS